MSLLPHHCSRCSARWNGLNTSHCSACHVTFTGLAAFDAHRDGGYGKRSCRPPESVGLVLTTRIYPCWGFPGDNFWENTDE